MLLFGALPLLGCCSYLGGGATPLFDQFFRKLTYMHPSFSQIFGKKCGFSPRWAIRRGGGGEPHFFRKIGEDEGCIYVSFPESCF